MDSRFARITAAAARRPLLTVALAALLSFAGAIAALTGLQASTSTDTLVDKSSGSYDATSKYRDLFGGDPVVIMAKGDLRHTVETSDLGRLLQLEGCLAGNVPKQGLKDLPPICTTFANEKPVQVVYGPGTFVNTAAGEILDGLNARTNQKTREAQQAAAAARALAKKKGYSKARQEQLANEASSLVSAQYVRDLLALAVKYGFSGLPSLDNVDFVDNLVFDSSKGTCTPKAKFAYLFPNCKAALIQVRLKPGLSDSERTHAINLIEQATREPKFKPKNGATYVVSGVPVVADALAREVQHATVVLLIAALVIMALTLALVFRTRMRLLPLALALAAAGLTFGLLTLLGGSLTMASVAALPILIGLAVDYAIQFQSRFEEASSAAEPAERAVIAAAAGGPTIASAGLATATGFLVLLLSPIPMVRGFGVALIIGIVFAFLLAITAGFAALVRWGDRERPADLPPAFPRVRRRLASVRGNGPASGRGAAAVAWIARGLRHAGAGFARAGRTAVGAALTHPRRVLLIGLAVAVLGWAADTQTTVVSDVRDLVPANLQALKDAKTLQNATDVSGEVDVLVSAKDFTRPAVINWMLRFQKQALCAHGYQEKTNCPGGKAPAGVKGPPELYPALSLPDLLRSTNTNDQRQVRALLDAVPPYFSQAVISSDRRTANLAFGIRLMPLEQQKRVIDDLRGRLKPPPGVTAGLAGLPVLAADANHELSSTSRRALALLAGVVAVFLVLLAVRRRVRLAAVPLIPIALATGWSAALLFLLRIPLNPMSAALGALVIAISTEFSVLLSARYREEREAGWSPRAALERTYGSTGAAVLASGTTAIAGFAALIASDIRMLRDFGIVTVVDLTVSLLGVMIVLPAALMWSEQHERLSLRNLRPRRVPSGAETSAAAGG
ncbi:MAG TPA: MMPL family transporter [Thermoleophilaceae bacterium]|nr:MMPL family transporter [Thermoleophilaceae bacterium]